MWGVGPETWYQITGAEYKTEPDSIKIEDLIRLFTENDLPKRITYRRFLLVKANGKRNTRRTLEKTNRNRKSAISTQSQPKNS